MPIHEPTKRGRLWTVEDEKNLIQLFQARATLKQMLDLSERTLESILARLSKLDLIDHYTSERLRVLTWTAVPKEIHSLSRQRSRKTAVTLLPILHEEVLDTSHARARFYNFISTITKQSCMTKFMPPSRMFTGGEPCYRSPKDNIRDCEEHSQYTSVLAHSF